MQTQVLGKEMEYLLLKMGALLKREFLVQTLT